MSGGDSASLYLEVQAVNDTEIECVAQVWGDGRETVLSLCLTPLRIPPQNDAVLEGLLTVFHTERSGDDGDAGEIINIQARRKSTGSAILILRISLTDATPHRTTSRCCLTLTRPA